MLWTILGLFSGAMVIFRLVTRRGRRQIWWICGTIAPASTVAALIILGNEHAVNNLLRTPNVAILLAGLCSMTGAGCSQIFWHAVRTRQPSRRAMAGHAALAIVIGVVMVALWLAAPVHDQNYPSFRVIPMSPQYVAYALVFQVYFSAVNANVSLGAYQVLRSTSKHSPGARTALILGSAAAATAVCGQALYLARLPVQARHPRLAAEILSASDMLTLLAVTGISASGITLLAVPRILSHRRTRQLTKALEPLWLRILELHPNVSLPPDSRLLRSPAVHLERMLIEVSDGLQLVRLPNETGQPPLRAIATALAHPSTGGPGRAAERMGALRSRREEEELFYALAQEFRATRAVGGVDVDSRQDAPRLVQVDGPLFNGLG